MKSSIKKKTDTEITLLISVDEHEIKHAYEHAIDKYRPQVKAAGFRPGKAPDNIVVREIGDATIQSETIDHTMGHAYGDALAEHEVHAVGSPKINVEKWVPYTTLEFEAVIEIVPPIKLADYRKIKKSLPEAVIEEAKIDEVIDDLRRRVAKRVPALRASEMGDEVKIDFEGTKNGEPVEGATGKGYSLKLGSNTFIPGFEPELVGLKVEESKTFTVTFPKDYHEPSLAGQPVEFTVKVHEVTSLELPEVDNKFVSEVGPFKTVAELRADIKEQLKLEAEAEIKRQYENELLEEIVKKSKLTAPASLVAQQTQRLKADVEQRLAQSGLTYQQYLETQKKSEEELLKEMEPEAIKRVQLALILSEVAKTEGMTVGNDEIEHELEMLRAQYPDPKMQEQLTHAHVREDIYNHLMAGKVINKLVEYATKNN